jgi:hypothetical protein
VVTYRLDELGWLQFEQLCTELLAAEGVERDRWHGDADDLRTVLLDDGELVVCAWIRNVGYRRRVRRHVRAEAARRRVRVLTNDDPSALELDDAEVRVLGHAEIGAALDAKPAVRRRVPFVLGVRDAADLMDAGSARRSTIDVEGAVTLARVFVPTRAYLRTLDVLDHHRFAVVTGPPEMGKTAIARMLGLAALTDGWEVHECTRPDELWERHARDRKQMFIADDAFGSTEYRPDAAERWALDLDRVLRAMDQRHRLVWTSRPAPLRAGLQRIHREHGVERWPQPAEVQVAASALDVEEKALILFRHTQAARVSPPAVEIVRAHASAIVEHEHFTPERIRRFVSTRLLELATHPMPPAGEDIRHAVREEIREPTTAMAASFRALPPEHRALLVALVDAPPGLVPERELTAATRRHADGGLQRSPAELVDRLADHFVRVVAPDSVVWVHPSWRDLVIDELARGADERRRFLTRCGIDGLLLALSTGGGAAGDRRFPLLIADADWDALAERLHTLVATLDDHDLFRLLATLREAVPTGEAEVKAVSETVLAAVRRTWDDAASLIPVGLLAAWLDLAELLGVETLPHLAPTWIDLVPTESIDMGLRDDVRRLDDWIALVEILRNRFQQPLTSFGYPDAQVTALEAAVASARRLAFADAGDDACAAAASALRKLWRVAPVEVRDAIEALERAEPSDVDWWEPHLPRVGPRTRPERTVVARILDDLRPAEA